MPRDPDNVPDETLRLLLAPGLGPATLARLRAHFGSDARSAAATTAQLAEVEGIGPATASTVRRSLDETDPGPERRAMTAYGGRLILHGDDDYPVLLEAIPDPPAAVWMRGRLETADRLAVAIVGSRRCTAYGRE